MAENNSVFVGRKPVMNYMNYVLACLTLFQGGASEVVIKARGRAISRAIDVAEIVRRRFLVDVKVKGIKIGTEQLATPERGNPSNVSTIGVMLGK
ncbi:MAG: DNA-binding protein Alba [Candidatus Bathyarchaeia archaeon]